MLMYCINEIEVTELQFRVWLSTVQDILWTLCVCVCVCVSVCVYVCVSVCLFSKILFSHKIGGNPMNEHV